MLGADKKCGDATRIIIIGNLRFRIRQDQCKLFIRINFFVFLIVFNVFSDSIDQFLHVNRLGNMVIHA